ncbi:MAG: EpsD family peptidyl-prolyl cis-trans isomerase [Burkholderiales bacterium]|nr:EpsD family peptidyl-prolyl cis-trans isomerase [Burkholderiales bacterium]
MANQSPNHTRLLRLAAVTLAALVLASCGKDEQKAATQVAAKVGSEEISVHQINFVMTRAGANPTPENASAVRKAALDRLIDQQLLVEAAKDKKVDRSPDVLMAMEMARREVLARAYLEQMGAALPKPTDEEIKKFYGANPWLFSERRVFAIQELIVPAAAGVAVSLRELIDGGKSITEIAKWLDGKGIKYQAGAANRTAEQIPLEFLPRIHALKDGQGLVIEAGQGVTALRVVASQSQPVPEAQALPRVQQFLMNQRISEASAQEMKRLKEKAKISYQGDFATAAAAPAAAPASPMATPPLDAGIEKGLKGLK